MALLIPKDVYQFRVTGSEIRETGNGKQFLRLFLIVESGPHRNRELMISLVPWASSVYKLDLEKLHIEYTEDLELVGTLAFDKLVFGRVEIVKYHNIEYNLATLV